MRPHRETVRRASPGMKWGLGIRHMEPAMLAPKKGTFIFDMRDARTGEQLAYWEEDNLIVRDAGILGASLFSGLAINPDGLVMLAVGTGATGDPLNPDAPTSGQRKLNTEIERKPFVSKQFRNSDGIAVSIRTNVVDYTTTFSESEAIGPLNEMGLISPFSNNPAVTNPILNGPSDYDPTIDVDGLDLMVNYLTFKVISKPATAILAITWRLSF